MTTPPDGATRSEDGHYWWDADNNQWQPVAGGAADPASAAGADHATDAASGAGQAVAESVSIEGACLEQDLEDADIDSVLAAAGVSLETS